MVLATNYLLRLNISSYTRFNGLVELDRFLNVLWAMYSGAHQYDIFTFHDNVDGISRLLLPNSEDEVEDNIFQLKVDEYTYTD